MNSAQKKNCVDFCNAVGFMIAKKIDDPSVTADMSIGIISTLVYRLSDLLTTLDPNFKEFLKSNHDWDFIVSAVQSDDDLLN